MLVQRGIADPDKLGIYGWSHGAFIVQFILAHSKMRFAAASLGEGGDYNPGEYWYSGGTSWPDIFKNVYGGPLTAKTAAAYLEFSPALNVDKVTTPLLMEYANVRNANYGAEFYVPLREQGVPAELVIYDDEEHNFKRPTVRQASMQRKVDWFNYWMLGKEDPDPAKAGQYTRWRQMRSTAPAH
jgi:dipeptidyl aminopeptidase/acylaminoacyl peptidase